MNITKTIMKNYLKLSLIYFLLVSPLLFFSLKFANARQFIDKEHIVIDLLSGVEWLKCSTGQTWNGSECYGEVIRLDFEQMQEAIKQANEQLDGNWRLPTRKELEGLVCKTCNNPKINTDFFPSTASEPYWTSDKNYWSEERFWTINFFTGYSFSRFTKNKPLASRLVRDR